MLNHQDAPTPAAALRRLLILSSLLITCLSPAWAADDDLGDVYFPSSASAAAQAPFQRGVAALHSFWFDEAIDRFRQAQRIDPGFAMAYWGEAMAHDGRLWHTLDRAAGQEVLKRLGTSREERLAKAPTTREKGFLEGAEILFFGPEDWDVQAELYREQMAAVAAGNPDDVEAAAFHALAVLGTVRLRQDFRGTMRAAALLEPWFERRPHHPGVLHYLIHSYDDPVHAPLGLRPARIYARVAPAAPHALHMPSHIFTPLGMWEEAAASNADAYAASVEIVERKGLSITERDYHSLSWRHYALLQRGQVGGARELLDEMAAAVAVESSETMERVWGSMRARQVIETKSWSEAAALLGPAKDHREDPYALVALGLAAARTGRPAEAEEIAGTLASLQRTSQEEGRARRAAYVATHRAIVLATAARARHDEAAAVAHLREAEAHAEESGLPAGPPQTMKPPAELLGELHLEHGDAGKAREAFSRALARTPRRPASLLGLATALDELGERDEARTAWDELARIWADADEDVRLALGRTDAKDTEIGYQEVFEKLKETLVGNWNGVSRRGELRYTYHLTGNGSALVQTYYSGGKDESGMSTVYHMDGDDLIATHYCGAQNQPRMKAASFDRRRNLVKFEFLDVTNLSHPDAYYTRELEVEIRDGDRVRVSFRGLGEGKEYPVDFELTRYRETRARAAR